MRWNKDIFEAEGLDPETPPPTQDWEAMIASRRAVLASLPTYAAGPAGAASWSALARGTMADLLREDLSWFV